MVSWEPTRSIPVLGGSAFPTDFGASPIKPPLLDKPDGGGSSFFVLVLFYMEPLVCSNMFFSPPPSVVWAAPLKRSACVPRLRSELLAKVCP